MKDESNDQELFDEFFVWLREKGLKNPILVEPRATEGAGKGLFVSRSIPANTTLLKIPSPALMNIKTLRHLYRHYAIEGVSTSTGNKTNPLVNGTQLISLHLALQRPRRHGGRSMDPTFGPYISILPREFDTHPLTWLAVREDAAAFESEGVVFQQELLEHLPPSASAELTSIWKKFRGDWEAVKDNWDSSSRSSDRLNEDASAMSGPQSGGKTLRYPDFLWAWLIVNTRCLFLRLFNRDLPLSNLTLCPLIDFANHTTSPDARPGAFPQIHYPSEPRPSNLNRFLAPGAAHDMAFMSLPDRELNEGEEVFLRYGGHCNRTLFVEYGFVDKHGDPSISEVNVEDLMDGIFRDNGKFGEDCRDLLKREGYTEKWCLFLSPDPPHPSFTLVTALRLLNSRAEGRIQACLATALAAQFSDKVEVLVRQDLERLCLAIIERSNAALNRLENVERQPLTQMALSSSSWVVENVKELWLEEDKVARAVLSSLRSGVRISDFP